MKLACILYYIRDRDEKLIKIIILKKCSIMKFPLIFISEALKINLF
jgi:hypothetical protein